MPFIIIISILIVDVKLITRRKVFLTTQIAKFMGAAWGPPGDDRTQVGPMVAPWTLLSGYCKWSDGNGPWFIVIRSPVIAWQDTSDFDFRSSCPSKSEDIFFISKYTFNSLARERFGKNFTTTFYEWYLYHLLWHRVLCDCHRTLIIDDMSTLVQVKACCRQVPSNCLNRYWPDSMSTCTVTRPQWVNTRKPEQYGRDFVNLFKCILTEML